MKPIYVDHRKAFDDRLYPINAYEWSVVGVLLALFVLFFKTP